MLTEKKNLVETEDNVFLCDIYTVFMILHTPFWLCNRIYYRCLFSFSASVKHAFQDWW